MAINAQIVLSVLNTASDGIQTVRRDMSRLEKDAAKSGQKINTQLAGAARLARFALVGMASSIGVAAVSAAILTLRMGQAAAQIAAATGATRDQVSVIQKHVLEAWRNTGGSVEAVTAAVQAVRTQFALLLSDEEMGEVIKTMTEFGTVTGTQVAPAVGRVRRALANLGEELTPENIQAFIDKILFASGAVGQEANGVLELAEELSIQLAGSGVLTDDMIRMAATLAATVGGASEARRILEGMTSALASARTAIRDGAGEINKHGEAFETLGITRETFNNNAFNVMDMMSMVRERVVKEFQETGRISAETMRSLEVIFGRQGAATFREFAVNAERALARLPDSFDEATGELDRRMGIWRADVMNESDQIMRDVQHSIGLLIANAITGWKELFENFGAVMGDLWRHDIWGPITRAWDEVAGQTMTSIRDTITGIANFFARDAWQIIEGAGDGVWTWLKHPFALAAAWFGSLPSWLSDRVWQPIARFFTGDIWQAIKGAGDAVWTWLKHPFAKMWEWMQGIATWLDANVAQPVIGFFGGAGAWLREAGENVVRGFADGIRALADLPMQALRELAQKLPEPIRKILGMESPSRVFADLGANTILGFLRGWASQAPAAFQEMLGDVTGFLAAADETWRAWKGEFDAFIGGDLSNVFTRLVTLTTDTMDRFGWGLDQGTKATLMTWAGYADSFLAAVDKFGGNILKALVDMVLDIITAWLWELIALQAIAIARSVFSLGLDAAAVAGALAAAAGIALIEGVIRPALTSLDVGTPRVPQDMLARVHQGEMVVPATFAEAVRRGDLTLGGGGGTTVIINNPVMFGTREDIADQVMDEIWRRLSGSGRGLSLARIT